MEEAKEQRSDHYEVRHLLEMIERIPGIGKVTMKKITEAAKEEGYV